MIFQYMQASISLLSYRPCKWRYFIRPSFYISVHSLFLSNEFLFSFYRFITPLYLRVINSILLDTSLEGNIAVNKLSVYTANSITASPEGSSRLVIFIELGGITSLSVKGDGIPVGKKWNDPSCYLLQQSFSLYHSYSMNKY